MSMIENLLGKMYIEGALMSKSRNIVTNEYNMKFGANIIYAFHARASMQVQSVLIIRLSGSVTFMTRRSPYYIMSSSVLSVTITS